MLRRMRPMQTGVVQRAKLKMRGGVLGAEGAFAPPLINLTYARHKYVTAEGVKCHRFLLCLVS